MSHYDRVCRLAGLDTMVLRIQDLNDHGHQHSFESNIGIGEGFPASADEEVCGGEGFGALAKGRTRMAIGPILNLDKGSDDDIFYNSNFARRPSIKTFALNLLQVADDPKFDLVRVASDPSSFAEDPVTAGSCCTSKSIRITTPSATIQQFFSSSSPSPSPPFPAANTLSTTSITPASSSTFAGPDAFELSIPRQRTVSVTPLFTPRSRSSTFAPSSSADSLSARSRPSSALAGSQSPFVTSFPPETVKEDPGHPRIHDEPYSIPAYEHPNSPYVSWTPALRRRIVIPSRSSADPAAAQTRVPSPGTAEAADGIEERARVSFVSVSECYRRDGARAPEPPDFEEEGFVMRGCMRLKFSGSLPLARSRSWRNLAALIKKPVFGLRRKFGHCPSRSSVMSMGSNDPRDEPAVYVLGPNELAPGPDVVANAFDSSLSLAPSAGSTVLGEWLAGRQRDEMDEVRERGMSLEEYESRGSWLELQTRDAEGTEESAIEVAADRAGYDGDSESGEEARASNGFEDADSSFVEAMSAAAFLGHPLPSLTTASTLPCTTLSRSHSLPSLPSLTLLSNRDPSTKAPGRDCSSVDYPYGPCASSGVTALFSSDSILIGKRAAAQRDARVMARSLPT